MVVFYNGGEIDSINYDQIVIGRKKAIEFAVSLKSVADISPLKDLIDSVLIYIKDSFLTKFKKSYNISRRNSYLHAIWRPCNTMYSCIQILRYKWILVFKRIPN